MILARIFLTIFIAFFLAVGQGQANVNDNQMLVNKAKVTVDELRDQFKQPLESLLKRARAVLIYPEIFKAGFIIGGSGGSGVLLAKNNDGSWSYPAFFSFGSGSIGLQAGISEASMMIVIMTDGGLNKIINDQVRLGVDLSMAIGPVGAEIGAGTTTNLNADMYVYAKSVGLFAGGAIDGAFISSDKQRNQQYYGTGATTKQIVLKRRFINSQANALIRALALD